MVTIKPSDAKYHKVDGWRPCRVEGAVYDGRWSAGDFVIITKSGNGCCYVSSGNKVKRPAPRPRRPSA